MNLSARNYLYLDEVAVVSRELAGSYEIFKREAVPDGDPIMCRMHDAFGTFNSNDHNCLGCNFASNILQIKAYLHTYPYQQSIEYSFTTYIILLYLLVERIDTLFNIIDLNETFRKDKFKILLLIRRWANFIKHPKAFLLTHHPEYTFQGSEKCKELRENASVIIDKSFVDKYYSNDEKNKELFKELENKEDVLVILPNMIEITEALCQAMHDCISVIADNAVYREVLKSRTTFLNYWQDLFQVEEANNQQKLEH